MRTYVVEGGDGPPVVLLHGASIGVEGYLTFHRQFAPLARRFRVVSFDQVGFGRTDMPADGRYRTRLERVDHVVAVLDALGLREASLIGHSEGAFIATRIAITRPDLARRLVLITSGGTAPALGGDADAGWMEASRRAYDYRNFPATADAFLAAARRRDPAMDAQHAALLHDAYSRALASGQAAMMRAQHRDGPTDYRAYVRLQEEHLLPHLATLTLPTLLIWASDDATVPVERGVALMRRLPRADLHVMSGASHAILHERAAAVTALLSAFCAGDAEGEAAVL